MAKFIVKDRIACWVTYTYEVEADDLEGAEEAFQQGDTQIVGEAEIGDSISDWPGSTEYEPAAYTRENLHGIEVFHHVQGETVEPSDCGDYDEAETNMPTGWYWWPCFPGCLPDGEPHGPFETQAAAAEDAQNPQEG